MTVGELTTKEVKGNGVRKENDMKIFNHTAYYCKASQLDEEFGRCDKGKCQNFCHLCMWYLEEADTTKGYENVAWCMNKSKEGGNGNESSERVH